MEKCLSYCSFLDAVGVIKENGLTLNTDMPKNKEMKFHDIYSLTNGSVQTQADVAKC